MASLAYCKLSFCLSVNELYGMRIAYVNFCWFFLSLHLRARTYGCHPDALTATERQSDLNGRAGPCTTFFIDHYGRSAEELSDWCYH